MAKKSHVRISTRKILFLMGMIAIAIAVGMALTASATTINLPAPTSDSSRMVRGIEAVSEGVDYTSGVDLGSSDPNGAPRSGDYVPPVPKFSLVNTYGILNENGPVEIPDDVRIYGLTEVVGGLINNGGARDGTVAVGGGGAGSDFYNQDLYMGKSTDSPVCTNIEKNTPDASVVKLEFFAPSSTIKITRLAFTPTGSITSSDITSAELYDGVPDGARLVGPTTATGTTFVFNITGGITVTAGTTKYVLVKLNIPATAVTGRSFQMGISSDTYVTAVKMVGSVEAGAASISGTIPAYGNTCTISSVVRGGSGGGSTTTTKFTAIPATTASLSTDPAITVELQAPYANTNPGTRDNAWIKVTNTSDSTFIEIQIAETGTNTGIFRGTIYASANNNPEHANIGVNKCSNTELLIEYPNTGTVQANTVSTVNPPTNLLCITHDPSATSSSLTSGVNTLIKFKLKATSATASFKSIIATKAGTISDSKIGTCYAQRFNSATSTWENTNSSGTYAARACNVSISGGNGVDVTTTEQTWRIIANIGCESGSNLRILVNNTDHDFVATPSSITKIGLPMSTTTRSAAKCTTAQNGVSIFGSFFPTAYAAAGAGDASGLTANPVTVYDDLYVYGNSDAEPGDVVISGSLLAGQAGLTSQISGDLRVIGGNITVANDINVTGTVQAGTLRTGSLLSTNTISGGILNVDTINTFGTGTVTIANPLNTGAITATGAIKGTSIGAFNIKTTSFTTSTGNLTANIGCDAGDILISCSGNSTGFKGTYIGGSPLKCFAYASGAGVIVYVQAVCFSPDGL